MAISHRAPSDQTVIAEVKSIRAELGSLNETSGIIFNVPLNRCYADGAQKDAVADAPGVGVLGLTDAVAAALLGNAASGNAKNDYAGFVFSLPSNYVPGGTISLRLRAKVADTLLTASSKVDAECKLLGDGALGSDLCETAAQQVTTAYAYYDFVITPTGLVAGNVLHFRIACLADDTGGTVNKAMSISKVDLFVECYLGKIGADVVAS